MVDHRVHRARALLAICLLMSMHSPLTSFRIRVKKKKVDVKAVTFASSHERFVTRPSLGVAADTNTSGLVGTAMTDPEESAFMVCEAFRQLTAFLSRKARLLNAMFDIYSIGLITHHAVHVWSSLRGFGADHLVSISNAFIGSFQLWLGSLWATTDVMTNICDQTLGTCVGIVNLLSLVLCIVFISLFFFPVFCASVAAHAQLGALSAWLGTHLGHMVLSMILLVWRKLLANICWIIDGTKFVISRVLDYVLLEARELVEDWHQRTGHRFEETTFREVVREFQRSDAIAAMQAAQEAITRQMMQMENIAQIARQAWNATRRSWTFAMSGMTLTRDNVRNYVDEGELVFSPRRGNSSTAGRFAERTLRS